MAEDQIVVVDVEVDRLSKSMQPKLKTLWGNEANQITIFRKPHNISKSPSIKKELFHPSVISIGPFHHGQKDLPDMEEEKWRFLQGFLSRCQISLELCLKEMKLLEEKTRMCYSEKFKLDSDTFVKMMLLDGCFVLEYFLKLFKGNLNYSRVIYRDLLLLENQIPFFIVEKLFEIGLKQEDRMSFVKYLAYIFLVLGPTKDINTIIPNPPTFKKIPDPSAQIPDSIDSKIPDPPPVIHHLVHLCYHYLVPKPEKGDISFESNSTGNIPKPEKGVISFESNSTGNISSMVIPSATELNKKGLILKPKINPNHMLDISFEYGVLQIPKLAITADNKPILANLVAFENSKHAQKDSPFTRFVIFLDNLVNTVYDVRLLQKCGIIENWLDSEIEVTHFINHFTKVDIFERDHYLAELYLKVNGYIKSNWDQSCWNRQKAKLIQGYFSDLWKTISVIVASILLVLTFVQTFYAVYAYKFPPSS